MSANLGKCHLDLPSTDEPGEGVAGTGVDVCGEEGLRLELAFGVTHEKPTDRHRRHAAAMPEGRAAGDLDETVGSAVPEHGGKPAQAAGFDEVSFGRSDRIAIDAAGADLGAPAPLDGVVEA